MHVETTVLCCFWHLAKPKVDFLSNTTKLSLVSIFWCRLRFFFCLFFSSIYEACHFEFIKWRAMFRLHRFLVVGLQVMFVNGTGCLKMHALLLESWSCPSLLQDLGKSVSDLQKVRSDVTTLKKRLEKWLDQTQNKLKESASLQENEQTTCLRVNHHPLCKGYRAVSAFYRIEAKPSLLKGLKSPYNLFWNACKMFY